MEKVKVLVVESEIIVAQSIVSLIEKMGYECVGMAVRTAKALTMAIERKPDIVLLDINIKSEKTGIWLAAELKKELNIPYVFLTSRGDKKTIRKAAEAMPYGYLLKPVEAQNLSLAIETGLARFSREKPKEKLVENQRALLIKDSLFIKDEYKFVKLKWTEIDYIKSDGNYVEIHGQGSRKVLKETLKNIVMKLPKNIFFQVHRSYLVNIEKIQSIGSTTVRVNDMEVPIVKQRRDQLLALLMV